LATRRGRPRARFRDNLVRPGKKARAEQKQAAALAAGERKKMVRDLADKFEHAIGNIVWRGFLRCDRVGIGGRRLDHECKKATQELSAAVTIVSRERVRQRPVGRPSATHEVGGLDRGDWPAGRGNRPKSPPRL